MATHVVRCPAQLNTLEDGKTIFLAGGITGCPEWQTQFINHFNSTATRNTILIDPRRKDFDVKNDEMESEQIEWEHRHILLADLKIFWFPKETLCPITLFELGICCARNDDFIVGMEHGYQRASDVYKQLRLYRPDVGIVRYLDQLAEQSKKFLVRVYGEH